MISKHGRIVTVVIVAVFLLILGIAGGVFWGVGPSPRCDRPTEGPAQTGWSARTLLSGGLERCYHLYIPPQYDPNQQVPTVLSFHGFLSNPASHALITSWHDLADKKGFLVVYPQGTSFPQRWNAGATWGDAGVDDVGFFLDIVDDLSAAAAVDPSRIYVNGFSNGGGMAVEIGCEAAGRVAALGSVAGAVVGMHDCEPSRPVPMMAFHGTADPIVEYQGGDMNGIVLPWAAGATSAPTYFVGAEEWTATWAKNNGCNPEPEVIPPHEDVQGQRYAGCDDDADVVFYSIDGGGHTWPGGWPIPVVGKTTDAIDATEKIWEFYERYALPVEP